MGYSIRNGFFGKNVALYIITKYFFHISQMIKFHNSTIWGILFFFSLQNESFLLPMLIK